MVVVVALRRFRARPTLPTYVPVYARDANAALIDGYKIYIESAAARQPAIYRRYRKKNVVARWIEGLRGPPFDGLKYIRSMLFAVVVGL